MVVMGLLDNLSIGYRPVKIQAQAPPTAEKPGERKSFVIGGASTDILKRFFNKRKRDAATLEKYRHMYEQGGVVSQAIDVHALYALMNGWRLDGDEAAVKKVHKFFDRIDFDQVVWDAIVDALVVGDAIQEIQPTMGGGVYDLITRAGESWDIDYDDKGVILAYKQIIAKDGLRKVVATLAPEEVVHIKLLSSTNSVYGTSLIGRVNDDIDRDTVTMEGATAAIKMCGYPTLDVALGSPEGNYPGDSDIDNAGKEFTDVKSKNIFVHPFDTVIKNLNQGGITGLDSYNKVAITRLCAAMGVPLEVLGLREGTTDNTAVSRINTFYEKIDTFQKKLARAYNLKVIDRITGNPGSVKLVFNPASQPTEDEIITMYSKIQSIDPLGSGRAVQHIVFDRLGLDWDQFVKYQDEEEEDVQVPEGDGAE
jgi:hypothetical protein